MSMFTPARFCLALGITAQGIPLMAHADKIPWWLGITFGCLGIFCQVITGFTGPVQHDASQQAAAKWAAQQVKENAK